MASGKIIRAKDVMHRDIISVDIQTLVKDAAKKMTDLDGDSIIVVDNNIPVGIVTYKDLVKKNITITNSTDIPIRKIMSSPLIHAGPDQSIWEIMDLIYARNIRRIPIIDEYDTLLGIVNLMSINKALSLSRN
ncbi:MAG: CBS domain-containing protein [Nitrosopumilus sp.]|nr:CBS domain-containing protein [Nitrosopumilus sp.]MDH3854621.1 CBS domain-containing protein [Nitrosopumilus sp.]